jgi:hypothetical protein
MEALVDLVRSKVGIRLDDLQESYENVKKDVEVSCVAYLAYCVNKILIFEFHFEFHFFF